MISTHSIASVRRRDIAYGLPPGVLTASILLSSVILVLTACGRPVHVWEAHTYATPAPASLNVSTFGEERVATLLPATYNHLQGYVPMVSHALMAACSETNPPLQLISAHEIYNKINRQQGMDEYAELDPSFAASHLLSATRLKQIGSTLGAKYVLQPGFAYVTEDLDDKFEFAGFVFLRTRVNSMGLWLRVWDAQTGEFLIEASGEATVAAGLLQEGSAVPLHETVRKLWRQMLQEGVLGAKTKAHSLLEDTFQP